MFTHMNNYNYWAAAIGKTGGKILNVFVMYWVGFFQVHCPFPCNELVMFWTRTPPLAPSGCRICRTGLLLGRRLAFHFMVALHPSLFPFLLRHL